MRGVFRDERFATPPDVGGERANILVNTFVDLDARLYICLSFAFFSFLLSSKLAPTSIIPPELNVVWFEGVVKEETQSESKRLLVDSEA